ncbi:heterokaryon incompatibility protein-domain-containing protein [Daldinia sp. FL1419]|nr:heterokaryon incompatibility protein-domain-containing protein [Daldinia sp. FL1419]
MDTALWVVFWIFFALFALRGFQLAFVIQFYVFLILMRTTNNEMSMHCWVAFWLSLVLSAAYILSIMESKVFYVVAGILTAVRFFITSDYEMPAPVFWVLVAVLGLTCRQVTRGFLIEYAVIIFNCHLKSDGLHVPGVLINYYVIGLLVAVLVVAANLIQNPGYIGGVLIWFACIGVLHNQMWPYNPEFGWRWIAAWYLLLQALLHTFAPSMPIPWYIMWVGIIVGLGYGIRPDNSLTGFVFWALTIWVLRLFLFTIYMFYFSGGQVSDLFPFNLFSHKWRMSKPRWYPLNSRPHDSLNNMTLCERCDELTRSSKLIMGSSLLLTPMTEEREFWERDQFTSQFATQNTDHETTCNSNATASEPSCHLCRLLWYSMSLVRRQALKKLLEAASKNTTNESATNKRGTVDERNSANEGNIETTSLPRPREDDAKLKIKLWEERPLSLYTYMQLYWGEVPIGSRLLVHRDNNFATPSQATKYSKTDSFEHFIQAKTWINMCRENHKLCGGVGNAESELPARMLYVLGGDDWEPGNPPETLRLVPTNETGPDIKYLAFSHCWGDQAKMRFKLLASNVEACHDSIDFSGLSKNMQDAITITLSLGMSYVWIDSLCIIQKDDTGKEVGEVAQVWENDWKTEAKKMGSVYAGAECTIASTGSSESTGGCFHERNVTSLEPCKIGVSSLDGLCASWIFARRDDVFDFERSVDLAPLNTRGWVMQERLLSRRILHFGAEAIYWECCGRSASELNPHGYSYKRFPKDFEDNYTPDLRPHISTRGDVRRAELEGWGISWATSEGIRLRPPPVTVNPDTTLSNQSVWQYKRGFWKNVLKPNGYGWQDDENEESTDRPRAGFRAAFEQLRGIMDEALLSNRKQVGRDSFSQMWFDVVEPYSRRKLTSPKDKLIAMKGISDEVSRATKYTYLYGLWKESLLTDLLWFAIDGPGKRLVTKEGSPVAPTWSWASIEAAVALDLLPETSARQIEVKGTPTTIEHLAPCTDNIQEGKIILSGPLLGIDPPVLKDDTWNITMNQSKHPSARFFPDDEELNISESDNLACLSFLVLEREKTRSLAPSSSEDVQGLVLRLVNRKNGMDALDEYERIGYFTTSYIEKSRDARRGRKELKGAGVKKLCLLAWSSKLETPEVLVQSPQP